MQSGILLTHMVICLGAKFGYIPWYGNPMNTQTYYRKSCHLVDKNTTTDVLVPLGGGLSEEVGDD